MLFKNPYKILDDVKSLKPKYILFTRTPFAKSEEDERFQFKLSQKLFMTLSFQFGTLVK